MPEPTPNQLTDLTARYTKTTERPTKVGSYWLGGKSLGKRVIRIWRSGADAMLYTSDDGGAALSESYYDNCTWTGPLADPAEVLEVVREVERLQGQRDFLGRGLQDMCNRLGKLGDAAASYTIYRAPIEDDVTVVTAPAGLIEAGQKVTREAADAEKGK